MHLPWRDGTMDFTLFPGVCSSTALVNSVVETMRSGIVRMYGVR